MFTFNGRDAHRVLPASKLHLPFHRPIGDILPERQKTDDDDVWSLSYDICPCRETNITSVNQHYSVCLPLVSGELGQEHMHC